MYYPKDPIENVEWRIECRERGLHDKRFRNAFLQACLEDPIFFFNSCLWVMEPRAKVKSRPFCLWPHQEPVIRMMDDTISEAMNNELPISLMVPKSRAQGGTYIYLGVFLRRALSESGFSAGLVTRNEELVDSRTDSDAVMYKLAWMMDRLPKWLLPEGYQRNLTEHTIALPNGSVFSGYSATGDVARGGRKTVFAFDEPGSEEFVQGNKDYKIMSSVGSVSNCTILVSTFGLDSGVFYESATDPDNERVIKLDWKDNPDHSRNAYIIRDGAAEAIRPEEADNVRSYIASHERELKSIERRGHKIDNKVRSPWYDAHCLLPGATPRFIARELDMDPRGAVGKLFDAELLDTVRHRDVKPPVWQGKPIFDAETLKLKGLIQRADGPLKLWFKPGLDDSAPLGPFSVGCDIAMGSDGKYSSNSVASIIDDRTGEQVGEYTIRGMQSITFADNVIGLCQWLRNACLGWEESGVSGPFAKQVMEVRCYGNVYYREVAEIGSRKKTRKAGWKNAKDEDKAGLFETMALAMQAGKYVIRSEELVRECGEYEWEKGKIIHRPTKNVDGNEKAHGDRCLVGGTMVLTERGEIPIESISVGDLVWTRGGLRPVQCCGETGHEEVYQLTLSNGRTLTGTGNHPVWTENRSWVPLQSLRGSDTLLACQPHQTGFVAGSISATHQLRRCFSMAGSTIATQTPSRGIGVSTSGEDANPVMDRRSHFMSRSGSITTDPSRKGTSSTTKTKIHSTTTSRISNALRHPSTARFTAMASTWRSIVTKLSTHILAVIAGKSTRRFGSIVQNSVAGNVERHTGQRSGNANYAVENIAQETGVQHGRALCCVDHVFVSKIEKIAPSKVYNLSIADIPEYFAQGVLVHNCIGAGVAWLVHVDQNETKTVDSSEETGQTPEYGSFLWRERNQIRKTRAGSPEFSIRDVMLMD